MKNSRILVFAFLFVTLCAFQCEDDLCETLDAVNTSFDIEMSSTAVEFEVGDEIVFTGSFGSDIKSEVNNAEYNVNGITLVYDFKLFQVNENNQPITSTTNKIDVTSTSEIKKKSDNITNDLLLACDETCGLDFTLILQEPGYYGIILLQADFVTMEECVVVVATGEKSEVQNLDILEEINTETVVYPSLANNVIPTPENSFFFKVVE